MTKVPTDLPQSRQRGITKFHRAVHAADVTDTDIHTGVHFPPRCNRPSPGLAMEGEGGGSYDISRDRADNALTSYIINLISTGSRTFFQRCRHCTWLRVSTWLAMSFHRASSNCSQKAARGRKDGRKDGRTDGTQRKRPPHRCSSSVGIS